tara:strand:- start:17 stop:2809 length:2793 start_codon:yes stop_codon:yes gene_type:complete
MRQKTESYNLINRFYAKPRMTKNEMERYFSFSIQDESLISSFRKVNTKISYMLILGFFKKYNRIINFKEISGLRKEVEYLRISYFSDFKYEFKISRNTYDSQVNLILKSREFSYTTENYLNQMKRALMKEGLNDLRSDHLIKYYLAKTLNDKRVLPLSAMTMTSLIDNVKDQVERRLIKVLKIKKLNDKEFEDLRKWVNAFKDDLLSEQHDFTPTSIRNAMELKLSLVNMLNRFPIEMETTDKNLLHLSDRAKKLNFLENNKTSILYLFSFLQLKLINLNEYLIESYKYTINDIKRYGEREIIKQTISYQKEFNKYSIKISDILSLIIDSNIPDTITLGEFRDRVFKILPKKDIEHVSSLLSHAPSTKVNDTIPAKKEGRRKLLKYILKYLELETKNHHKLIKTAVESKNGLVHHERVVRKLKSGQVYKNTSKSYRSLERDIINKETWNKVDFGEKQPLEVFKIDIKENLHVLEDELESLYLKANEKSKKSSLVEFGNTPKSLVLKNLLDNSSSISISELLQLCFHESDLNSCFKHIKNGKEYSGDRLSLVATLISQGRNLGIFRMSQLSDFPYYSLKHVNDNFFTLSNLRSANDLLVEKIQKFSIFKYYDIEDGVIFSSSDGQKFETQHENINSRYSQKYFGTGKGISNFSLIANHIPVNAKIISSNEYEGHHLLDLLLNNESNVIPKYHATDTHGVNSLNFALLNFFGYEFAPRIKGLSSKKVRLSGFKNKSSYKNMSVIPDAKVNKNIIIDNWDEVLRVVYSLKSGLISQTALVKKLASRSDTTPLKKALWEYNNILKSIFILNYLSDDKLKSNVQKALNRGENYHQMKRAIAYANGNRLKGNSSHDQQIWSESARLIANAVIYYNSKILSHALDNSFEVGNIFKQAVIQSSPISWSHVNFMGVYEFKEVKDYDFWKSSLDLSMEMH